MDSSNNNYSENGVQNEILLNQKFLLDDIKAIQGFFELSDLKKPLIGEYLKYITFGVGAALLMYKLNKKGYTDDDEECKKVFRAAYNNSLEFLKKFVNTNLIEFPIFNELKEEYLILSVKVKLEGYVEDIKQFIETGERSYIEEIEEEDYGTYTNVIQHKFIQDIYEIEFEETNNGISLKFYYKDYLDSNNTSDYIQLTLDKINLLAKR